MKNVSVTKVENIFNINFKMKLISLILARGGSKGIPGKNIKNINGTSLLCYAASACKKSNASETWVSTDSMDIISIAKKNRINTIVRPEEISQDDSKSEEALLHFAQHIDFDILVFVQPTSPLITSEDINRGLDMMNEYDSVFSAYREHWVPRWSLETSPLGWDINNRPMRQDKEEVWVENGAFYITTREQLLNNKLRYGGRVGVVEMPLSRSFQIDTYEDLNLINKILK